MGYIEKRFGDARKYDGFEVVSYDGTVTRRYTSGYHAAQCADRLVRQGIWCELVGYWFDENFDMQTRQICAC